MDEKIIMDSGRLMREKLREAIEQIEKVSEVRNTEQENHNAPMDKQEIISLLETLKSDLEQENTNKRLIFALDYSIDAVRYSKNVKFYFEKD